MDETNTTSMATTPAQTDAANEAPKKPAEQYLSVMTWNIKQLNNSNQQVWEIRKGHIVDTIISSCNIPDIIIIQELSCKNSEVIMTDIVERLNGKMKWNGKKSIGFDPWANAERTGVKFKRGDPPYSMAYTDRVNPMTARQGQCYGIIYRNGIFETKPEVCLLNLKIKEYKDEDFEELLKSFGEMDMENIFDYCPVEIKAVISNQPQPVVIIGCHLSTKEIQNTCEAAYLQKYCLEKSKDNHLILLGDFNVDQCRNRESWDCDIDTDNEHLSNIRELFLKEFSPCIGSNVTTNLFPFLAAFEDGIPKHNDNIWISKNLSFPISDKHKAEITDNDIIQAIDYRYGCAKMPPGNVLQYWDEIIQTNIRANSTAGEMKVSSNGKSTFRNEVSNLIMRAWSDHRPICTAVILPQLQPPTPVKQKKNRKQFILAQKAVDQGDSPTVGSSTTANVQTAADTIQNTNDSSFSYGFNSSPKTP